MRCLCSLVAAPSIRRRMETPCLLRADGGVVHSPRMRVMDQAPRPNCGIFTNRHRRCNGCSHATGPAGKMARVTGKAEIAGEAFAPSVAVLLLPMLAFACIVADPGPMATLGVWLAWMVLALAIDAVSPRGGRRRNGAGSMTTPLVQGSVLLYALWLVSATAKGPMSIAMIAVMVGIAGGTVGISAAHELVHRRGSLERGIAQAFMLLVSYPHFPIVHLRVHHPYVGTPLDPGTSRLNEPLVHFVGRAFVLAWHSGWRVERSRLARKGLTPRRMENAILRGLALQAALFVALGTAFGWIGLGLFVGQS